MTAAKRVVSQIQEIPVDQLHLSPAESRKTLDQAALQELAASIALKGVQEPLLVRPIDLDCMSGQPLPGPAKVGDAYQIVAGQRRHAASKLAGKTTCPCIVREMTDEEARELGIISNLQREDLPAIEEATAFAGLLSTPGQTIETVAAKLGKSASYVGRRLKLLDAIEAVREALRAGAIEVGHALELARLDEAQQLRLLSRLNCGFVYRSPEERASGAVDFEAEDFDDEDDFEDDDDQGEPVERTRSSESQWKPTDSSVAELRREIERTTLRVLADAPFPLDAPIPPVSCADCPKRSGNAALLFNDCAQDTCTDRDCFDTKIRVWVKAELQRADGEKRKLVMLSDGYTENRAAVSKWDVRVIGQGGVKSCASVEQAIWINGSKAGHTATICRDAKCKTHKGDAVAHSSSNSDPAKQKADRKKLLAKVRVEKTYRAALFKAIADAPGADLQKAFDCLVTKLAAYAIGRSDSQKYGSLSEATGLSTQALGDYRGDKLAGELAKRPQHVRVMIALLATKDSSLTVHEYDISNTNRADRKLDLEELAQTIGLDWKALRKQHAEPKDEKPAKSEPAKPAMKKAAVKPKKTILSAAARKRIADAQRKRWSVAQKAAKKGGAK